MSHSSHYAEEWYFMTIVLAVCCCTCLMLIIIQILSFKWYQSSRHSVIYSNPSERLYLYGVFVGGVLCSTQCFALHISNILADWYCIYGTGICTVFYAAEKSFLYGFFLERAKSVQILMDKQILPTILTKYVLPIYIAIYFLSFSIISVIVFRGQVTTDDVITSCIFYKWFPWLFIIGAIVDIINSSFLLVLFIYPLYNSIKCNNTRNTNNYNHLLKVMHINIILSAMCMISGISAMIIASTMSVNSMITKYLWMIGNIDMFINSVCTFIMADANREYIVYLCKNIKTNIKSNCVCNNLYGTQSQSMLESGTSIGLSTIYEYEEEDTITAPPIHSAKNMQSDI